ncbi:helix-turn-helix domain-containing protein [Pedobacter flavus]|uniref:Helix-turn-helix transcriptional regulator n=1 Tax=Pedobacter flavus TaxID=3113906 RepID=A0ABU7H1C7_9SPHI|nr:helix-turn-helix transcriptional regulator [Pedobacter sp. VNH31]MEE1884965.1 helix-turn-helix transcriptional regulator [Pedobacter sp. VNH31]
MKIVNKMKTVSLDEMIDKHVGKIGSVERDAFEYELSIDLIGHAIKQARKERNLTQEELGKLVDVQKAQISKIENSIKNARLDTIMKIFKALGANVNFNVELDHKNLAY